MKEQILLSSFRNALTERLPAEASERSVKRKELHFSLATGYRNYSNKDLRKTPETRRVRGFLRLFEESMRQAHHFTVNFTELE